MERSAMNMKWHFRSVLFLTASAACTIHFTTFFIQMPGKFFETFLHRPTVAL